MIIGSPKRYLCSETPEDTNYVPPTAPYVDNTNREKEPTSVPAQHNTETAPTVKRSLLHTIMCVHDMSGRVSIAE